MLLKKTPSDKNHKISKPLLANKNNPQTFSLPGLAPHKNIFEEVGKIELNSFETDYLNNQPAKNLYCQNHGQADDGKLLFTRKLKGSELHPLENAEFFEPSNRDMCFPMNLDAEWVSDPIEVVLANVGKQHPRQLVTVQGRHILHEKSFIGIDPVVAATNSEKVRHPVLNYDDQFAFIPYIKKYYPNCTIERHTRDDLENMRMPTLQVALYGHFLMVDMGIMCIGEDARNDFKMAVRKGRISQNRRLTAGKYSHDYKTLFVITINDQPYRLSFKLIDTLGLYGNASYKELCSIAEIPLQVKDEMKSHIANMDKAYFEVEIYDLYAHEDTHASDIIYNHSKLMKPVCHNLDIDEQTAKLTMGSTVNSIFEQCLRNETNLQITYKNPLVKRGKIDPLKPWVEKASAEYLATQINSSIHLLAKCNGGRCRNANPLATIKKNRILCDIDLSGAYTNAMRQLDYCLGTPITVGFKPGQTLVKEFLKKHGKDLLDGKWYMRVSTKESLKYAQNLCPSWFNVKKNTRRSFKQDSDSYTLTGVVDLMSGENKILEHELDAAPFTSYDVAIIEELWSKRQREDFYNKVCVDAIIFYPKDFEIESVEALPTKTKTWTCKVAHQAINDAVNPYWLSYNLGSLLVDKLKAARSLHPDGSPLNKLYKLFINTTYGNSVSKFFSTANVVVGNNITAMCRAIMYCAEIGLNMSGTITDGHFFDVNEVVHKAKGKYLNLDKVTSFHTMTNRELMSNDIARRGHLFTDKVYMQDVKLIIDNQACNEAEAKELLGKKAREHLINLFPGLEFLKEISFSVKMFGSSLVTQGSANYQSCDLFSKKISSKFRSAEKSKKHYAVEEGDQDDLVISDYYEDAPGVTLLNKIRENPESVPFLPIALKNTIIKPKEYAANKKWRDSDLIPGDNGYKIITPSYVSLAQFTFSTKAQYISFQKIHGKLKAKCGISFEIFFINKDGNLNYKAMIEKIEAIIRSGEINPLNVLDPHNHKKRNYTEDLKIRFETAKKVREHMRVKMCGFADNLTGDFDDYEG